MKRSPKAESPWSKHVPEGSFDTVVIGSGMGGMTAAALLAETGERVLVLEQHYVPGGFTHTFRRPGYEWDVGVHAVGEVTRHSLTGRLLDRLTDGRLEWASLGETYDEFTYPDGLRLAFPDTPAQFRENLIEAFPHERRAIDEYLHLVKVVAGTMRGYYLARLAPKGLAPVADLLLARKAKEYLTMRAKEVIEDLTEDRHELGDLETPPAQIDDGIAHELSRTMPGGESPPIGLDHGCVEGREGGVVHDPTPPAPGHDGLVLEEQELVRAARQNPSARGALQLQAHGVGDATWAVDDHRRTMGTPKVSPDVPN